MTAKQASEIASAAKLSIAAKCEQEIKHESGEAYEAFKKVLTAIKNDSLLGKFEVNVFFDANQLDLMGVIANQLRTLGFKTTSSISMDFYIVNVSWKDAEKELTQKIVDVMKRNLEKEKVAAGKMDELKDRILGKSSTSAELRVISDKANGNYGDLEDVANKKVEQIIQRCKEAAESGLYLHGYSVALMNDELVKVVIEKLFAAKLQVKKWGTYLRISWR